MLPPASSRPRRFVLLPPPTAEEPRRGALVRARLRRAEEEPLLRGIEPRQREAAVGGALREANRERPTDAAEAVEEARDGVVARAVRALHGVDVGRCSSTFMPHPKHALDGGVLASFSAASAGAEVLRSASMTQASGPSVLTSAVASLIDESPPALSFAPVAGRAACELQVPTRHRSPDEPQRHRAAAVTSILLARIEPVTSISRSARVLRRGRLVSPRRCLARCTSNRRSTSSKRPARNRTVRLSAKETPRITPLLPSLAPPLHCLGGKNAAFDRSRSPAGARRLLSLTKAPWPRSPLPLARAAV